MFSLSSQSHVLTDEPKWSSASLCITLNHLGRIFRPQYTHQLVGGECWRGHRPLESVLRKANADYTRSIRCEQDISAISSAPISRSILHKSHENHGTASKQLEIRVMISPSCQMCRVDIIRSESDSGEHGTDSEEEPDSKRRRADSGSEFQQQIDLSSGSTSLETKEQDVKTTLSSLNPISHFPMKDSEIMDALCKALPPITSSDDISSQVENCFLSEPIGDVLEEYMIPATEKVVGNLSTSDSTENDKSKFFNQFILTVADGRLPHVSEYHRCVENLSLFYIENADTIDVANDADGGFWKIVYIFQKHNGDDDANQKKCFQYSLVGYFTLFHFIALFHKPDPGLILRICQALVLPPFQGQGHGRRLLQTVYRLAQKGTGLKSASDGETKYNNIIQVNVEDPAPAFVALRNKMDLELVLEHCSEWNWPEKGSMWTFGSSKSLASNEDLALFFSAMTEKEASEMSIKAKITPNQIHITNELMKLKAIHDSSGEQRDEMSKADKDTIERFFRLMVKRRLNKENRDDLLEEPTKNDQKALLAKLFQKEQLGYERILSKLLV